MTIIRLFALKAFGPAKTTKLLKQLQQINNNIVDLQTEKCYHIEIEDGSTINESAEYILRWILKSPEQMDNLTRESSLSKEANDSVVIEVGPRFNFSTAESTNSVAICHNVSIKQVKRIEVSIKYLIRFKLPSTSGTVSQHVIDELLNHLSDKMTQCRYTSSNIPVVSFDETLPKLSETWSFVPLLKEGRKALEKVNTKLGLAFDDWDMDFYMDLFCNVLKRDPTTVELFDCAQSNSEHSRHWFFKGNFIIDGVTQNESLIKMIGDTQKYSNNNNTILFSDNSSAIEGFIHKTLKPTNFTGPGPMKKVEIKSDLIFTAETHNMPTAVSPFSGATTGTGGRIRDVQGVGCGGLPIAGTAGYCVGNLNIPGYELPYETYIKYPPSFADARKVIIDASNGASDYGNKFGEPVISGFAISYGLNNGNGDRDEYVKPIMFSGGVGTMNANHRSKLAPEREMLLVKLGGPVYRIGVGGGAASSVEIQGDNSLELDFNAVQRGDAEMENKLNRVVRACIEMGDENPILAIHDQGAGGNGNVLKELVEPGFAGAIIFSKEFQLGDPTITSLELWGAEYQENNAILCYVKDRPLLEEICARERCPINFVGVVTGDGYVTLVEDYASNIDKYLNRSARDSMNNLPFDLHLKHVLGEMPKKTFDVTTVPKKILKFELPAISDCFNEYVNKVLSIMTVGSKRFLTNKVDRCVTGLIAQQQCVGPLHTPLADCGIVAVSHFGVEGIAISIGTQPIKGLISNSSNARMSVAEAISNLVFAGISDLADVKCSGNWMWAAKLPGEGAKIYEVCKEMCQIMKDLNIAVDGGKDSLSMAARCDGKTIKSPGTLVISTYAPCPDVRIKITPDFKSGATGKKSNIIWVNIEGKFRIGGSALLQSFGIQGNNAPNLMKTERLKLAFNITQKYLKAGKLQSGHDISDGGLVTCLLEMAFGGICGFYVDLTEVLTLMQSTEAFEDKHYASLLLLFAEECGWVLEVDEEETLSILNAFKVAGVPAYNIGHTCGKGMNAPVTIKCNNKVLVQGDVKTFYMHWERTNFELEKLQMNEEYAIAEYTGLTNRKGPTYYCSVNPDNIDRPISAKVIRVAVLREEGVNGDREMIATLMSANFEVHDVTMYDLLNKKTSLNNYRGVIFPGGFSYADTLGSAKGWAASIIHSELLAPQFAAFKDRQDTFSLGVCNGCQLMSLIGWVGNYAGGSNIEVPNVALLHNASERYECRWVTLKVNKSRSIMLRKLVGSTLGCWIAHGEGKFCFKSESILTDIKLNDCVTIQYVDDDGLPTELYPMNPNGSIDGIAGICSLDGRHLAMMPHPERCSNIWQWPYVPHNVNYKKSPWQLMFDEAYNWCEQN